MTGWVVSPLAAGAAFLVLLAASPLTSFVLASAKGELKMYVQDVGDAIMVNLTYNGPVRLKDVDVRIEVSTPSGRLSGKGSDELLTRGESLVIRLGKGGTGGGGILAVDVEVSFSVEGLYRMSVRRSVDVRRIGG